MTMGWAWALNVPAGKDLDGERSPIFWCKQSTKKAGISAGLFPRERTAIEDFSISRGRGWSYPSQSDNSGGR